MDTIAFDLGETLISYVGIPLNWQEHYAVALKKASDFAGFNLTDAESQDACEVLKKFNTRIHPRDEEVPCRKIFSEFLERRNLDETALSSFGKGFFSYFQQSCKAYPETRQVLENFKKRGFKVAVLTDVPYGMPRDFVIDDLKSAGIEDCIDILLTSVDTGYRKPHPNGFLHLARVLGIAPEALTYVGNEKKDIEGIRGVGGHAILVDRDAINPSFGQDRSVASLMELV